MQWQTAGYDLAYTVNVPDQPGIYTVVRPRRIHGHTLETEVLYVGQAVNLRRRFKEHLRVGEPNASLASLKGGALDQQYEFWWSPVAATDLDRVERMLIQALQPSANRIRYESVFAPDRGVDDIQAQV